MQGTRDRRSSEGGHILIGGTGRAGTTLLVQYFTVLGFDTGFTETDARTRVNPVSHAGLEHSLKRTLAKGKSLPYVAKSPYFGANLAQYLEDGQLQIRGFIVPMRDLRQAAESRRRVTRLAEEAGNEGLFPGGVMNVKANPAGQQRKLAIAFHALIRTLVAYNVPIHFLSFPEFATRKDVLFKQLAPLLAEHGVTIEESRAALASVVKPDVIHDL